MSTETLIVKPEAEVPITLTFDTVPVLFTTENEGLRYQINILGKIQSITPEGVVSSEWQSVDEFMQYMHDLRIAPKSPFTDAEEQMIDHISINSTKN